MRFFRPWSCTAVAAALFVCAPGGFAEAQALISLPSDIDARQLALTSRPVLELNIGITPCQPDRPVAAVLFRPARVSWAGRFQVTSPGTGAWRLRVESTTTTEVFERVVAAGAQFLAGPIGSERVRISLVGPGGTGAVCPTVILVGELLQKPLGEQRGLVGSDDRWPFADARLTAHPDAAVIRQRARATVYLETVPTPTSFLPCSGFFIAEHVLMTAAHCIEKHGDVSVTHLFVNNTVVPSGNLKLLIMDAADFALVWVDNPPPHDVLAFGQRSSDDFMLWQNLSSTDLQVSVFECRFERLDGTFLSHRCDSSDGASGAAVEVLSTGAVVGLHVRGCDRSSGLPACVNESLPIGKFVSVMRGVESIFRTRFPDAATEVFAAIGRL